MKKMGRLHRPFYRICAIEGRNPRDGRVLEQLGTYDPMIPEVDARAQLDSERIQHWISMGAKPSDKVGILIKKYGTNGTHVAQQKEAVDRLAQTRRHSVSQPQPVAVAQASEPEAASPAAE
jgi:small subunit ribosomal protein S16